MCDTYDFPCPDGQALSLKASRLECLLDVCTKDDYGACCAPKARCDTFPGTCPEHKTLRHDAADVMCNACGCEQETTTKCAVGAFPTAPATTTAAQPGDGGTAGRRGSAVRAGRVHRGGRPGGVLPGDVRAVRPRYVPRQRGRAARRRLHLQQRPGGQVLRPRVLPPAREVFHLRVRLNHPAARRSQRRVRDGCVPAGGRRGRVLPATPDLQRNADARLPAPHGSRAHAAQRAVCHGRSLWHAHERQAVVLHGCGELRGVRQFHVPSPARHQDESREPGAPGSDEEETDGPGLLLRARGALHDPGLPGPGAPRGAQRHVHGVRVHGAGDLEQCCVERPNCSEFNFSCAQGTSLAYRAAERKCRGSVCHPDDTSLCCVARASCRMFQGSCPEGSSIYAQGLCQQEKCTDEDMELCCIVEQAVLEGLARVSNIDFERLANKSLTFRLAEAVCDKLVVEGLECEGTVAADRLGGSVQVMFDIDVSGADQPIIAVQKERLKNKDAIAFALNAAIAYTEMWDCKNVSEDPLGIPFLAVAEGQVDLTHGGIYYPAILGARDEDDQWTVQLAWGETLTGVSPDALHHFDKSDSDDYSEGDRVRVLVALAKAAMWEERGISRELAFRIAEDQAKARVPWSRLPAHAYAILAVSAAALAMLWWARGFLVFELASRSPPTASSAALLAEDAAEEPARPGAETTPRQTARLDEETPHTQGALELPRPSSARRTAEALPRPRAAQQAARRAAGACRAPRATRARHPRRRPRARRRRPRRRPRAPAAGVSAWRGPSVLEVRAGRASAAPEEPGPIRSFRSSDCVFRCTVGRRDHGHIRATSRPSTGISRAGSGGRC
ncbi:unnamed protein product [Prorocentrum cordatum]|uniref:Uncharacterized protein n=1 Tax=Prorocentrum cordatum TaxID=2364126 RepID=A0ABN9U2P7_9DINO|nr:unnamed protein product [Polarella glacialis]